VSVDIIKRFSDYLGAINVNIALGVVTCLLNVVRALLPSDLLTMSVETVRLHASRENIVVADLAALFKSGLAIVDGCTDCVVHNFFVSIHIVVLSMVNY
jgi:hypothetical protein